MVHGTCFFHARNVRLKCLRKTCVVYNQDNHFLELVFGTVDQSVNVLMDV